MVEQMSLFPEDSSTSSREEPRARTCLSRDSAEVSELEQTTGLARPSHGTSSVSSAKQSLASSFGRTWTEFDPTRTSRASSARLGNAGILLRTASSTPSMSDAPDTTILTTRMPEWTAWSVPSRRDDGVCGLSDVLEPTTSRLRGYFLSTTACAGIIRRVEKRGKKLNSLLENALEYMIAWWSARITTEETSQAPSPSQMQEVGRECQIRTTLTQ